MVGKRQEEGLALADNSLEVKIIQPFFFNKHLLQVCSVTYLGVQTLGGILF